MRVMGVALALVLLAVVGIATYLITFKPKQRPASTEQVERTPARVERGRYLAEVVFGCFDCHSKHDLGKYGAPPVGPVGAGGECVNETQGFPGEVCMANITPDKTGLGDWTDGEIIRAVREGVDRAGKTLFPMMPYSEYSAISEEDARALVAYLRALPPASNPVPEKRVKLPLSLFMKFAPRPLGGPVPEPDHQDKVAYGKYLAKVSGCQFCHTPVDKQHQPIPGLEFAGGQEFPGPWGALRSANLTPHATGMGERTEQQFIGMFKAFDIPVADLPAVSPDKNTVMPWLSRAKMTEADLGAIYAYLKTVRAVDRAVDKRPRPALPGQPAAAPSPAAPSPAAPSPAAH
jgi:mono/diheme cytochrome c family protein